MRLQHRYTFDGYTVVFCWIKTYIEFSLNYKNTQRHLIRIPFFFFFLNLSLFRFAEVPRFKVHKFSTEFHSIFIYHSLLSIFLFFFFFFWLYLTTLATTTQNDGKRINIFIYLYKCMYTLSNRIVDDNASLIRYFRFNEHNSYHMTKEQFSLTITRFLVISFFFILRRFLFDHEQCCKKIASRSESRIASLRDRLSLNEEL